MTDRKRTLHSHRKALVERRYVEEVKRGAYKVTEQGYAALGTAATARHLHVF
jgi:predicted transcriptional regulator